MAEIQGNHSTFFFSSGKVYYTRQKDIFNNTVFFNILFVCIHKKMKLIVITLFYLLPQLKKKKKTLDKWGDSFEQVFCFKIQRLVSRSLYETAMTLLY